MNKGIVLSAPDATIEAKAKAQKLPVVINSTMVLAFNKTLFVTPGTRVPWDLLPAAWHFLERWDAAVPLWRYGVNAGEVGSKEERARTQEIIRDLRVLLHSVELLFVRDNDAGRALVHSYRTERLNGTDLRLAFLRALYQVKPRLCVLPCSWLAEVQQRSAQDIRLGRMGQSWPRRTRENLVRIEVQPGRWVQCHTGQEELVRAQFEERLRRHG